MQYGTKNDWEEYVTNAELQKHRVSSIEELISNSYKPYIETATNALQKQNQYDISGAYKNYLNAQMAYKNSGINSDAYKNYYDKQNRASYQTNLDTANANFTSGLQDLYSSVQSNINKDAENYREQIAEKAKTMSGFMQPMWATMYNATESPDNPYGFIEQSEDGKTYNLTKYGEDALFDVDDQGNRKFSDLGKQLLASTLLGEDGSALEKYLASTGDLDAIEDWQNYGSEFIQALVGKDNTYSWKSYEDVLTDWLDSKEEQDKTSYEENVSKWVTENKTTLESYDPDFFKNYDENKWSEKDFIIASLQSRIDSLDRDLKTAHNTLDRPEKREKLEAYRNILNSIPKYEHSVAGTSNNPSVSWTTTGGIGTLGAGDSFSIAFDDDSKKYELEVKNAVTHDKELVKQLNKLSTGSEDKDPGNKDRFNFLGTNGDFSSKDPSMNKNLVVYKNKIYMFGGYGWSLVEGAGAKEFVDKYLGK